MFAIIVWVGHHHTHKEDNEATPVAQPAVTQSRNSAASLGKQVVAKKSNANIGSYKNGTYIGLTEDAYYGNVQVKVIILSGKIINVVFLQHPNDNPTSRYINQQVMPILSQEVIQAQSASVHAISGASDTSQAFEQSLVSALQQAKNA